MRVLLTGASGQLGAYVLDRLIASSHEAIAWSGTQVGERRGVPLAPVDLADLSEVDRALEMADPAVIIHAAAVSSADAVVRDPERARMVNVTATGYLAEWAARRGRRLLFTSTDLVFGGDRPWNREEDPAEPVLAYGRSKRDAELRVLASRGGLVARISLLYGPSRCGRPAFYDVALAALRRGEPRSFFGDEFRTPLDLATAATILVRLAESEAVGLIHVAGRERVSRFEHMRRVAEALGLDATLVRSNRRDEVALPEPRPADVSLQTERLAGLFPDLHRPTIEEAVTQDINA